MRMTFGSGRAGAALTGLVLGAILMMTYPAAGGEAGPAWRWPVPSDTSWEIIDGRGSVERVDGRWVWDAEPVGNGVKLGVRLPIDLADFDELRFEYKPTHGPVQVMITTDGYPNDELSRNWYDKHVQKHGEWNRVTLDLDLDDDGRPTQRPESQDLWLQFRHKEDPLEYYGDRRRVEIRNVRFVRHPVAWESDYFRVRTGLREDGKYEVAYPVTLRNLSERPVEVTLRFDREPPRRGEPLFEVPNDLRWTLEPVAGAVQRMAERWGGGLSERHGDVVTVWVRFTADAEAVARRAPLWTEIVRPSLHVKGFDEPLLPLHSSRRDPWMLTTPPRHVTHPIVEAMPATIRRAKRRSAADGQFHGMVDRILQQAERELAHSPRIPRQNIPSKVAHDLHGDNAARCLGFARAYALSGREAFREAALELLLAYADRYTQWRPIRPSSTAFHSHTMANTLAAAFRLDPFVVAYDYLKPTLSDAEQRRIEDGFLRPCARVLDGHVNAHNNQMAQHNEFPFYFAMATHNWPLAMRYVEGRRGLFALRRHAFDRDGMAMERDLGYHWNTIDPMIGIAIALDHAGYDDTGLDLASTLEAPLARAGDPRKLQPHSPRYVRYEWGYAKYGRRSFLAALNSNRGLGALLHGVDRIPDEVTRLGTSHLEHAGYLVMRRQLDDGKLRTIGANYGSPHHRSHLDLMSIHASQDGQPLLGMMSQSEGRKGWYSTIADSLLAVNGRDQLQGGRGRLVRVDHGERWQALEIATAEETPLYDPAVKYHRMVVETPEFLLLLDRAAAPEPVDFHWALYPGSDADTPEAWATATPPGLEPGPDGNGPSCPAVRRDWVAAAEATDALAINASVLDRRVTVPIVATPASRPYAFQTPGRSGWRTGLLLHHKAQRGGHWATAIPTASRAFELRRVTLLDADGKPLEPGRGIAVRVKPADGEEGDGWLIAVADRETHAQTQSGKVLDDGWLIQPPASHAETP